MADWHVGDLLVTWQQVNGILLPREPTVVTVYDPITLALKNTITIDIDGDSALTPLWCPKFSYIIGVTPGELVATTGIVYRRARDGVQQRVFEAPQSPLVDQPPTYHKNLGSAWATPAGAVYYTYQDNDDYPRWHLIKAANTGFVLDSWSWLLTDSEFYGDNEDGTAFTLSVNRTETIAYINNNGWFNSNSLPNNDSMIHRLDLSTGAWLPKLDLDQGILSGTFTRPLLGTLAMDHADNFWISVMSPGDQFVTFFQFNPSGLVLRQWEIHSADLGYPPLFGAGPATGIALNEDDTVLAVAFSAPEVVGIIDPNGTVLSVIPQLSPVDPSPPGTHRMVPFSTTFVSPPEGVSYVAPSTLWDMSGNQISISRGASRIPQATLIGAT